MNKHRQIIPPGFGQTSRIYKISNQYFLMIPKNASNTILFGTSLKAYEINRSELDSNVLINVFIREPVERFKAALIESIKRSSLFNNGNLIANFYSVPVSKDINYLYQNVFEKICDDPFKFVLNILEIINTNFYDPHLCPQWFFFTDVNRNSISRIRVNNLEMLDKVMKEFKIPIKKNYNIKNSFDLEKYKNNKAINFKRYIKNALERIDTKLVNSYHSLKFIKHSSIKQSDVIFNFINYDKWLIISKMIKNTIDDNQELKDKIYNIYFQDNLLYKKSFINKEYLLPKDYKF